MLFVALALACSPPAASPDSGGTASSDSGSSDSDSSDSGSSSSLDSGSTDSGATSSPEYAFSYALIADPHVTGPGDHEQRLIDAVAWIEEHAEARDIQLVFILGDIAWNDGFDPAIAALSQLSMPWVPVIGDNCIQSADEEAWHQAFSPQLDHLAATLPGWTRQAGVIDNPERGVPSWFQSYGFDHDGLRFVALDWNTRVVATGWGELPDLHDFDGGTLPFLREELDGLAEEGDGGAGEALDERVVFLSHMPMFHGPGGFDVDEKDVLEPLLGPYADTVRGNHAGHLHGNGEMEWEAVGMHIDTTDATWDDVNALRVVDVYRGARRFTYQDEIVEIE